jgi:serine/threonine protein kinase
LTGKPAFPGKSYNDVLIKNRNCEIIIEGSLFENVPKVCKKKSFVMIQASDLLFQMIDKDPTKRISAEKALHHPYFVQRLAPL